MLPTKRDAPVIVKDMVMRIFEKLLFDMLYFKNILHYV